MMTDNGLAPLAAALAARHRGKHERIEQGPDEHNLHAAVIPEPCDAERHREEAAAILAALPDDWCGHAAEALDREAFIGRQWAEIARLRAIEEAARAYRKAAASLIGYVDFARLRKGGDEAQGVWLDADRALRGALGSER
jgi:hypothetical protein